MKFLENKIMIPKKFNIGGSEIRTEYCHTKEINGNAGRASIAKGLIQISNVGSDDKPYSKDYQECTFYHELIHLILDSMAKFDLSENEQFVETFANYLHQYEKTKK